MQEISIGITSWSTEIDPGISLEFLLCIIVEVFPTFASSVYRGFVSTLLSGIVPCVLAITAAGTPTKIRP